MSIHNSEPTERDLLGQPIGPPPTDDHDPRDLPEDEQVVYEFEGYSLEHVSSAAEAMADSGIPHAWDGTDLIVALENEEVVDGILDAVERALGVAEAEGADLEGEVVYDLAGWHPSDRDVLTAQLDEAEIPWRIDEDELVVAASDEALVETILDGIADPSGLEAGPADVEELDDEEEAFDAMGALFLAADRLRKDASDPNGIGLLEQALEEGDPDEPPYGVEPLVWQRVMSKADNVADALAEEDLDTARKEADELRKLLRPLV